MPTTIVMTGGGTAGHVTPNLALIENLKSQGCFNFVYVGSYQGIEKKLTQNHADHYCPIITGKLRRSKSLKNLLTPFQLCLGILQSLWHLTRHKPSLIFSKGGFVAVPVVIAGSILRIPVIVHESDLSPGLANRISFRFAQTILTTFPHTRVPAAYQNRTHQSGTPIRASLYSPQKKSATKTTLLIVGGSQGSRSINHLIWKHLDKLLEKANLIHLCGANHFPPFTSPREGYQAIEYAQDNMADLIAQSDCIISRAGANSICEWLCLHKPHLLIPLPKTYSRGDQIENADYFSSIGVSLTYDELSDDDDEFLNKVQALLENKENLKTKIKALQWPDGTQTITEILLSSLAKRKISTYAKET